MTSTDFIEVTWGDEAETYLRWDFHGNWTGKDYFDSVAQLWELMDSKQNPVKLLIDMCNSRKNPSNLKSLIQAVIRKDQCNISRIVVVSPKNIWKGIFEITARFYPPAAELPISFVDSMEEANLLLGQPENTM